MRSAFLTLSSALIFVTSVARAASSCSNDGYVGYNLSMSGDPDSATYDTACTPANVSATNPPPDVFLNASVHVTEIDLTVTNLTAKINIDAQVLSLLTFSAGVNLQIDEVQLLIEEVDAHVLLEARLENLVLMIDDVLNSLDLNPVLATLGSDVGQIVNDTTSALTGATSSSSTTTKRSYDLATNTLFSVNNYQGNTHRNRILEQDGSIVDQFLDNHGHIYNQETVGSYLSDMTYNGVNQTMVFDNQEVQELQYVYNPFHGLYIVSAIFVSEAGNVVGTQVISESGAQGTSTVGPS